MLDKVLNLYSTAPMNAPTNVVVFDDYVGGENFTFKLTNLDSYAFNIYAIYIDDVAQDLMNSMFVYNGAWGYDDYGVMHTHQAGATLSFALNLPSTAKKVKIIAQSHVQGHYARVEVFKTNLVVLGALQADHLELCAAIPYIDFKNISTQDYKQRIIMNDPTHLETAASTGGLGTFNHA